jgi:hypothetical protein
MPNDGTVEGAVLLAIFLVFVVALVAFTYARYRGR